MESRYRVPTRLDNLKVAHEKWLDILRHAETLVKQDYKLQATCKAGVCIKGRERAAGVLGRIYASYCKLINDLYDAYLNSVQLQRVPYILNLVNLFVKRMYELRRELTYLIVTDYFNVDTGLIVEKLTPFDIQIREWNHMQKLVSAPLLHRRHLEKLQGQRGEHQWIVVPYHFPLECRTESAEQMLQKMWADAIRRKRPKKVKPPPPENLEDFRLNLHEEMPLASQMKEPMAEEEEEYESTPDISVVDEGPLLTVVIQKMERYRQWFVEDFRKKCNFRRTYFVIAVQEAPVELKERAAKFIQKMYREVIKCKREHVANHTRDKILGMVPESSYGKLSFYEENTKVYKRRRDIRLKINDVFLKQIESEKTKILFCKWDGEVEDITNEIRAWFMDWYYGYGFFPEYPYPLEGGTLLVINGTYPSIEEQVELDELAKQTKKTSPSDAKAAKAAALAEEQRLAEVEREAKKKEAEILFKLRCNPAEDPGYCARSSEESNRIIEALEDYRATWSLHDQLTNVSPGDAVYGFLKPLLVEDLMCQMHKDCRVYVDTFMRLELQLLVKAHKKLYMSIDKAYPKKPPRKRPPPPPVPKPPQSFTAKDQKNIEPLFDMNLITQPTTKLCDVQGDINFANYEFSIRDPNATFLTPSYGDVKDRIMKSCILACGVQPGATKRKAVMLVGPPKNGKSFLVDAVAGELNAVKIDISPEVLIAGGKKPGQLISKALLAARAFQPSVIFLKDIERVFMKKVPPNQAYLKASKIKRPLLKMVKQISDRDKVIFIATCSFPWLAKARKMVSMFEELVLVPAPDYGTITKFLGDNLQKEASVPFDFPYNPLGIVMKGYGFGFIMEVYNKVLCPERKVSINVNRLTPMEFLNAAIELGDPMEPEDLERYEQFCLVNSSLYSKRLEYAEINEKRDRYYTQMREREAKKNKNSKSESD